MMKTPNGFEFPSHLRWKKILLYEKFLYNRYQQGHYNKNTSTLVGQPKYSESPTQGSSPRYAITEVSPFSGIAFRQYDSYPSQKYRE